jgi:CheY-like chemotaxis protein
MNRKLNCILAIDDDEANNFFTRIILEDSECAKQVITLQSGRKALDYLAKNETGKEPGIYFRPDIIFLDINMPAMNGWEFLEEYKKLPVNGSTIIVMLTTSLFPEDRLKAAAMPEISGFESKPLTAEKVTAILEKYFAKTVITPRLSLATMLYQPFLSRQSPI